MKQVYTLLRRDKNTKCKALYGPAKLIKTVPSSDNDYYFLNLHFSEG